jgi:hypothetical protein
MSEVLEAREQRERRIRSLEQCLRHPKLTMRERELVGEILQAYRDCREEEWATSNAHLGEEVRRTFARLTLLVATP